MSLSINLAKYGIQVTNVLRNAPSARLYEDALQFDGEVIVSSGAIAADSGAKKGRSPKDKRIVDEPSSRDDVWWGNVNIPLSEDSFAKNKSIAVGHLNSCERLYVIDGFGGWDLKARIKVRVICKSDPKHKQVQG